MMTFEIEGLTLYDDGSIGIGGTPVPAGAEFPAVQLGDWTLSKAIGQGRPLIASRGDGRRLVFEFKGGKWSGTETDTLRATPRRQSKPNNPADLVEQLKHLAAIPLAAFQAWPITEAEAIDPDHPERIQDTYSEGDVTFYNDGTVVLGYDSFPPCVGIEGHPFNGSVAYREPGGTVLVIASPAGVRWYDARCHRVTELPYDSRNLPKYKVSWAVWTESRGITGRLKRLTQSLFEDLPEGMVKTWYSRRERVYGCRSSGLVYVSSNGSVYVRALGREVKNLLEAQPELRFVYLGEPRKRPSDNEYFDGKTRRFVKFDSGHPIWNPFVVVPRGERISYHSPNLSIDAWPDRVLVTYSDLHLNEWFENAQNTPNAFTGLSPSGYIITHGDGSFSHASWGGSFYEYSSRWSTTGWAWSKLIPRRGAVSVPQLDTRPLKRLG